MNDNVDGTLSQEYRLNKAIFKIETKTCRRQ